MLCSLRWIPFLLLFTSVGTCDELAIYLGVGEVVGPGKIVQVDQDGRVLAAVDLPNTPYGLAMAEDRLVAAIPRGKRVVSVSRTGKLNANAEHSEIPHPLSVAIAPESGDIIVADNGSDIVGKLKAADDYRPEVVVRIPGSPSSAQNMSVAATVDGYMILGSSSPAGVFRLGLEGKGRLGNPVLPRDGSVAASPDTKLWAACQPDHVQVFYGEEKIVRLGFRKGQTPYRSGLLAIGPERLILAAVRTSVGVEIVEADIAQNSFRTLFRWQGERLVCLAVGTRLPWPHR